MALLRQAQQQEAKMLELTHLRALVARRSVEVGRRCSELGVILQLAMIRREADEDSFDGTLDDKLAHYHEQLVLIASHNPE